MNRPWNKLLLALLLLLSQTAVGAHDVQHLGSAHGEHCAVYLAQDHSALSSTVSTALPLSTVPMTFQSNSIELLLVESASFYTSRAPPHI